MISVAVAATSEIRERETAAPSCHARAMMRCLAVVAFAAFAVAAAPARADSRAWTAAKKVLPAGLQGVGGGNVVELRRTRTFKKLWARLLAQSKDRADEIAAVEKRCGFHLYDKVDSLVVGLDKSDAIVGVIAFDASAKQLDCIKKSSADLTWIGKDVAVVASDPKLAAGGIADDKTIAGALANVKTGAPMWFVVPKPDLPMIKTTAAYGHATFASGNAALEIHIGLESMQAATALVGLAGSQIEQLKQSPPMPELAPFMKALTLVAQGSEVVVKTSASESALESLIDKQ
jgi:hypothetical protein